MRRIVHALLAGTLVLSACQLESPASRHVGASKSTGTTDAKNVLPVRPAQNGNTNVNASTSLASPSPQASASLAPTPKPTPAVPMKTLTGLIKLDASYIIAAGGGNIIAAGGGNIIAAGGGNIIAAGGGNIIAAGGGNIIAAGGGNIIAAGGGNIIAAGGGNYRVLENASVPVGTLLPVRGMVVVPVSLVTGKLLGEPVKTDDTGTYSISVPESESNNIRLLAALPAEKEDDPILQDPRLRYSLVVSSKQAQEASTLDEDTSLVSTYLRRCFLDRFKQFLTMESEDEVKRLIGEWGIPLDMQQVVLMQLSTLRTEAKLINLSAMSEAEQDLLVQRIADTILAHTDLTSIQSDPSVMHYPVKAGPALPLMVDVARFMRTRVTEKLAEAPNYFNEQPFLTAANAQAGLAKPYRILKASDFGDVMVGVYLSKNTILNPYSGVVEGTFNVLDDALRVFGANVDPSTGIVQADQLEVCATCIFKEFNTTLFMNKGNCRDEVIEQIRTYPQTKGAQDRVSL